MGLLDVNSVGILVSFAFVIMRLSLLVVLFWRLVLVLVVCLGLFTALGWFSAWSSGLGSLLVFGLVLVVGFACFGCLSVCFRLVYLCALVGFGYGYCMEMLWLCLIAGFCGFASIAWA